MRKGHKSYKLPDDSLNYVAEMVEVSSSALFTRKQELKNAQIAYDEALKYNAEQEAKLVQMLVHSHIPFIVHNRIKYSIGPNKTLMKELVLD